MASLAEVSENALRLTVEERASLANQLLASLDELHPDEADRLWTEESSRRLVAFRAGRASSESSEDVARKAAALFR